MTQMLKGKSLPACKQMMDCSICPDVLITLRRNQSTNSITELSDISLPTKLLWRLLDLGFGILSIVRRNQPRVPGEQA